ncbi:MAG: hypothetical protein K2Y29_16320 [Beijerinckiaceae bacterium]|nr:hypothetical protein [Beijerinckiaceae bacterium]
MSAAANTGALIGLAVGGFHYVLTLTVMGAIATRKQPGEDLPGLNAIGRRLQAIKLAMLGTCFLVFPLVGYVAGAMLPTGETR